MIQVLGDTQRSFVFPATYPQAFAYFRDPQRILNNLTYVSVARDYGHNRFQVLYEKIELAAYRIQIYANVEIIWNEAEGLLRVEPLPGGPVVKTQSSFKTSSTQGLFRSRSIFHPDGDRTRIEYHLELAAELPTPTGLKLMPVGVVNSIADRITNWRMHEIADNFIDRSLNLFSLQQARTSLELT